MSQSRRFCGSFWSGCRGGVCAVLARAASGTDFSAAWISGFGGGGIHGKKARGSLGCPLRVDMLW